MNQNNFRFNGKCFSCGKLGHKSQFCRSKERNESNQVSDALTAIACNAEHIEKSYVWYLDSAQWPIFRKSWTKSKKKNFEILK